MSSVLLRSIHGFNPSQTPSELPPAIANPPSGSHTFGLLLLVDLTRFYNRLFQMMIARFVRCAPITRTPICCRRTRWPLPTPLHALHAHAHDLQVQVQAQLSPAPLLLLALPLLPKRLRVPNPPPTDRRPNRVRRLPLPRALRFDRKRMCIQTQVRLRLRTVQRNQSM
jgi:hypothetical protein